MPQNWFSNRRDAMKPITTGTEDFREFIDNGYYYVDKSDFIETALKDKVSLFTRPRRFGKTLNMSMLSYFLSIKEKENAYLFNGLRIMQNSGIQVHRNRYPVIFLTLKDMKRGNFEQQKDYFGEIIAREVRKHEELFDSPALLSSEKELLKRYDFKTATSNELEDALLNLCVCLEKHYGSKTVILIDEYDVPLQSAYLNRYYPQMSDFMSNIFSSALKTNSSLERGVLTGCLRISKESIFTGLNNFTVFSIFSEDVSRTHFGFTQEEVETLLKSYGLEQYMENVREWYDGYLFGGEEIYNPWSVLNYVKQLTSEQNTRPRSYWANTSGNDIVYNYIKNGTVQMNQEFETLIQGKSIEKTVQEELTYREMDDPDNIYSFLLFTGYLRTDGTVSDSDGELLQDTFRLVIPNREVRIIFENQFKKYFDEYTKDRKGLLLKYLKEERTEDANHLLNDILFHSVSFFDNYEAFYHGFLTGLFAGYPLESNRESGYGRFDIAVLSNNPFDINIVIECKLSNSRENLKEDSRKACTQIRENRYIEGLQAKGYDYVKGYGISFWKKSCYITEVKS